LVFEKVPVGPPRRVIVLRYSRTLKFAFCGAAEFQNDQELTTVAIFDAATADDTDELALASAQGASVANALANLDPDDVVYATEADDAAATEQDQESVAPGPAGDRH